MVVIHLIRKTAIAETRNKFHCPQSQPLDSFLLQFSSVRPPELISGRHLRTMNNLNYFSSFSSYRTVNHIFWFIKINRLTLYRKIYENKLYTPQYVTQSFFDTPLIYLVVFCAICFSQYIISIISF